MLCNAIQNVKRKENGLRMYEKRHETKPNAWKNKGLKWLKSSVFNFQ